MEFKIETHNFSKKTISLAKVKKCFKNYHDWKAINL